MPAGGRANLRPGSQHVPAGVNVRLMYTYVNLFHIHPRLRRLWMAADGRAAGLASYLDVPPDSSARWPGAC